MKELILRRYAEGVKNLNNLIPKEGDHNYNRYLKHKLTGEDDEIQCLIDKVIRKVRNSEREQSFIKTLKFKQIAEGAIVKLQSEIGLDDEIIHTEYTGTGAYGIVIDQYEGVVYYNKTIIKDKFIFEKFVAESVLGVFYGLHRDYYDIIRTKITGMHELINIQDKYDITNKIVPENILNSVDILVKKLTQMQMKYLGLEYDQKFIIKTDKELALYYVKQVLGAKREMKGVLY